MLRIRAIKIEIITETGLFGSQYEFTSGLNIIQGNNTTGKSSLFQSILYCLGFEELLGGKNEKTMQSVFKDEVEYKGEKISVLESNIYLEIENKNIISIKRSVQSQTRSPKLVDIIDGAFITGNNKSLKTSSMYLHDKGGASDNTFGFHAFLESFLGWNLPEVYYPKKGDYSKLYMQMIAPCFIVEQKSGWGDFLNNIPIYGVRNSEARVVEFILGLDVYKNEKKKQDINNIRQILFERWRLTFEVFKKLANKGAGEIRGLSILPEIITEFETINIYLHRNNLYYSLSEFTTLLQNELFELENKKDPQNVSERVIKNEKKLEEANDNLNMASVRFDNLSNQKNFEYNKYEKYKQELKLVQEDLRKNKGALKLKELGSTIPVSIAKDFCPACHQAINDSLLPNEIHQIPMGLEKNISYLDSQLKMIEIYIEGQKKKLDDLNKKLAFYNSQIIELRKQIRSLKKELTADERLPSEADIEKKIILKNKIKFYMDLSEEFDENIERLKLLVKDWESNLAIQKKLPSSFFSDNDFKKLNSLETYFTELLDKFNYVSKPKDDIKISRENYLPVIKGQFKDYNIRFDSSGSDFIRSIWAFTCALYKTSKTNDETFHPSLLMFDEPAQQSVSNESFSNFLYELSHYKKGQVLVFASFNNSEADFKTITKNIAFKHLETGDKMIRPLNEPIV